MDRYDKRALIALGMVLLAIVAIAFLESLADGSAPQPPTYTSGGAVDDQGDYGRTPPRMAASDGFNWFHDSIAQWGMAIFTAAGAAISLVAVRLVNATLKTNIRATNAAVEAVTTAKEIGTKQLRPYILFESATAIVMKSALGHPDFIEVNVTFRNCGMTPGIIKAASSAAYAPDGTGKWPHCGRGWHLKRIVVGQNQAAQMTFKGIDRPPSGEFSWFRIGILIWYDAVDGESYEDHVWLIYDGEAFRQGLPDTSYALYRPDPKDYPD